jgi:hypothetical protein
MGAYERVSSPGATAATALWRNFVYVDSWNHYCRCLKGTAYRQVNIAKLALLASDPPNHNAARHATNAAARTASANRRPSATAGSALARATTAIRSRYALDDHGSSFTPV